jgi:large subunit ribosomal protein L22
MIVAQATAKYIRTSSQKAGLVLDLIRGKDVNHALAALQFSKKSVARDIAKVLRSAVANAQQATGFGGDVERLFISECHANQGPSLKRVRPAPMGRAFRVVKRSVHLTIQVTERPQVIAAVGTGGAKATKKAGTKSPAASETAQKQNRARGKTAAAAE